MLFAWQFMSRGVKMNTHRMNRKVMAEETESYEINFILSENTVMQKAKECAKRQRSTARAKE